MRPMKAPIKRLGYVVVVPAEQVAYRFSTKREAIVWKEKIAQTIIRTLWRAKMTPTDERQLRRNILVCELRGMK
jgi:hypothetical protein